MAAFVGRELGTICLPAPNTALAAVGMVLDLLLDIFINDDAVKLFLKAETEDRRKHMMVLAVCFSIPIWHLVSHRRICLNLGLDPFTIPHRWRFRQNNTLLHLLEHRNL